MTERFNPKNYLGKNRIFRAVGGTKCIQKILEWNRIRQQYVPAQRGNCYVARRWESTSTGIRKRISKTFATLEEARAWTAFVETRTVKTQDYLENNNGPVLCDVIYAWKARRYHTLAASTQAHYEKILRLHFQPLINLPIRNITPAKVDEWIAWLIACRDRYGKQMQRKSFKHELTLLGTILNHYANHCDDLNYSKPIKERHWEAVQLRNRSILAPKDLREDELMQFLRILEKIPVNGTILAALATVQYYHALRISEAAALRWEDVRLDLECPRRSRLYITQHICWIRGSQKLSFIEAGFKNSDSVGGIKEHPMHPAVFDVLRTLRSTDVSGLIFRPANGAEFFSYRQIQSAYDRAFEAAGLPYRGTHVMRHGGTRLAYDEARGDQEVAKQLLGNSDLKSVQTYAKRSATALAEHFTPKWDEWERRRAAVGESGNSRQSVRTHLKLVFDSQGDS